MKTYKTFKHSMIALQIILNSINIISRLTVGAESLN